MDGQQSDQKPTPTQFAPGDTISPQQQTAALPPAPVVNANEPTRSAPQPQQLPDDPQPQPAGAQQPEQPTSSPQQTTPDQPIPATESSYPTDQTDEVIAWTASEFVAHHKTGGWYVLLLLASVVAAVLIWLGTKDVVSAIVVVFAGGTLAWYAGRQPRQLSYQLDPSGLTIGQRHYSFNEFRSFSVVPDGAFSSVVFTPHKRFGTLVTIYYDPQDEEQIVDAVSQRLPHQERRPDPIDGIMRRIRF